MQHIRRKFLWIGLLMMMCWTVTGYAQQPTAVITKLSGSAVIFRAGAEIDAELKMVLTQGDAIETNADSSATLALSEGSTVLLKQKTRVNLDVLLQTPQTGARQSKLKLLYGRIRAFLSPGHQQADSTFEMETPNAHVGVKFSQPALEVSYERELKMTIVRTYTVCVSVVNLVTDAEIQRLCPGHQAVIKNDMILVTKILETAFQLEDVQRMLVELDATTEEWADEDGGDAGDGVDGRDAGGGQQRVTDNDMGLLVETIAGNGVTTVVEPATGSMPQPGIRPSVPQVGSGSFGFTFTVTEE